MLAEVQNINGVTIFSLPKRHNTGWRIEVIKDDVIIKTGYAFTKEDIDTLRGKWISQFWGKSLN